MMTLIYILARAVVGVALTGLAVAGVTDPPFDAGAGGSSPPLPPGPPRLVSPLEARHELSRAGAGSCYLVSSLPAPPTARIRWILVSVQGPDESMTQLVERHRVARLMIPPSRATGDATVRPTRRLVVAMAD